MTRSRGLRPSHSESTGAGLWQQGTLGKKTVKTQLAGRRIAAVCLIMFWHREDKSMFEALLQASADIIICFRSCGQGSNFLALKFGRPGLSCESCTSKSTQHNPTGNVLLS